MKDNAGDSDPSVLDSLRHELDRYISQSSSAAVSFVLVTPLLVLYQLGLGWTRLEGLNGVDVLTLTIDQHLGPQGAAALNIALILICGALALRLYRRDGLNELCVLGVIAESLTWATLFMILLDAVHSAFPLAIAGSGLERFSRAVTVSLGAGVHEELVFRLLLFGAPAFALARHTRLPEPAIVLLAALPSTLLFAGAHHFGLAGEAFSPALFCSRAVAGLLLCGLFRYRGFAVAVYTHVLYDCFVLLS